MTHGQPTSPTRDPKLKEGWRAAAAAYRRVLGEVRHPHRGCDEEAYAAAIEAFKEAVPGISHREATVETTDAISYASCAHPVWLYALYKSDG
jgi:hypothetical protein